MEDHGARQHHEFGGSGMARVIACPGSYNMSRAVPPEASGVAAQRGTLCHEIIDHALKTRERSADAACMPWIAHPLLDDDIIAGAQECLDYVYELLDALGDEAELYCEEEFILETMTGRDVGGYCDICIYVPSLNLLYVIDYKNGVVFVNEFDNVQLKFYAVGAVQTRFVGADTIICVIVQPNAVRKGGKVAREYVAFRRELDDFAVTIDEAIIAALQPDAPLIPGEYQCEWCPARAFCHERERIALQVANKTFSVVRHVTPEALPDPATLTAGRLAEVLKNKDMLYGWLDDVEKAAYAMLMSGGAIPGYKLVEAQARRKWYGEPEQVAAALAALLGADADTVFPRKLMTITSAERMLKARYTEGLTKKADKDKALTAAYEYLAQLTNKDTSGNLTLVPESDKREAAGVRNTSQTFGTVMLPPPA